MSDEKNEAPAPSSEPTETEKLTQGVTRFAKYTAPAMLAMLASSDPNKAFAATFL